MNLVKHVGSALIVAGVVGAPQGIPPGSEARKALEARFLAVPYWGRAAWARSRYEALGTRTVAERYAKAQYLRLWQSVRHMGAPESSGFSIDGTDEENRRLDLLCNRLSRRDLASIREAQAMLKRHPDDLMLAIKLADVAGLDQSIDASVATGFGETAVRLAPQDPSARLARGSVCFNRFLEMRMPGKHFANIATRTPLARRALDDFQWFLSAYSSSVPREDVQYARAYVSVVEACVRILKKEARLP